MQSASRVFGGCEFSVRRRRARCVRVTGHLTGSLENDGRRLSNQNSTDLPTAGFLTSLIGRYGYLRLTPALWNVVPRGRSAPERELRAEQGPLELGSCSGMTDSGVDLGLGREFRRSAGGAPSVRAGTAQPPSLGHGGLPVSIENPSHAVPGAMINDFEC